MIIYIINLVAYINNNNNIVIPLPILLAVSDCKHSITLSHNIIDYRALRLIVQLAENNT